jgi:L-ascorbate metabolism protein UlaG (beta-lactamase superfamily)
MSLIQPIQKDQELLLDADARLGDHEHFHIWWLGQSGYLLQWKEQRILIDPYLSDSLTVKYHGTQKPHVRMSERVIDPELFRNISAVSSSHNHTDHLDAETLMPIIRNNPDIRFIIPEANRDFVAERIKSDRNFPVGLNDGRSYTVGHFTYHGVPAKHNEIDRDAHGNCKYMGYVIEFGGFKIYHSGDTLWFPTMVDYLQPFQVDLALLPINGNDPAREVAGNLDTKEAAQLAKAINAKMVIPCHYDMFEFNTANPRDFEKEAQSIEQPYKVLSLGERWGSDRF